MRKAALLARTCIPCVLGLACTRDTSSVSVEKDPDALATAASSAALSRDDSSIERGPAPSSSSPWAVSSSSAAAALLGWVDSTTTTSPGGGCEEAKARYRDGCARAPASCPELTDTDHPTAAAFGAVLDNGTYLDACGAPPTTAIRVCVAVQHARVQAVTVTTSPGNETIGRCIVEAVHRMSFPQSRGFDVATTTFQAQ